MGIETRVKIASEIVNVIDNRKYGDVMPALCACICNTILSVTKKRSEAINELEQTKDIIESMINTHLERMEEKK